MKGNKSMNSFNSMKNVIDRSNQYMAMLAFVFSALFLSQYNAYAGEKMTYWIDVRTQDEFAGGSVEGSVLIPYEVITDHITSVTEDKTADIRVYCRSGRRSEVAKDALVAMGYTNVINEGGYEEIISRK